MKMNRTTLKLSPYQEQLARWPKTGRHILGQFDTDNIVVYQAYRSAIGHYAAEHQKFGGEFSYIRMSWIKPNFLWMMYRSGWGTKPGQEIILAITIPRSLFEDILAEAVPSTFGATQFENHDAWKEAGARADVRLQWDPDHTPSGAPQERRAIQLGLRGKMLKRFGQEETVAIEDVSEFVAAQRENLQTDSLVTPEEDVYIPTREEAKRVLAA